jgi:hypothetical protein
MTGTKVGKLAGGRLGEIGGVGFKDENAWGALFQTPFGIASALVPNLQCADERPECVSSTEAIII